MRRKIAISVLALIAFTGPVPVHAAEWNVRIGGEFLSYFGYASTNADTAGASDFDGFDVKTDAKVAISPEITLDNGIQFGAVVEVDAQDAGIGDSFLFVDSAFGYLEIGSRTSAGHNMFYAAPDETLLGTNDGSAGDFIPFDEMTGAVFTANDTGKGTLNSTFIENGANENDNAQRISYYTRRFSGVQFGVSYARDRQATQNVQVDLNGDDLNNIVDLGVNYVRTIGPVDIAIAARYGIAGNNLSSSEDPEIWGGGVVVSSGGISIGGSFSEQNNTALSDGQAFDVGVSYSTGPWAMSLTYQYGRNADDEQANAALAVPAGADEELQQIVGGVTYELADGVALGGFVAYVAFDEEVADSGIVGGDDVDGFVIGGGIALEF